MLFGCGCLLLVLGIASVAFTFKAHDILAWWFSQVEETLLDALPPEVTLSETQRLQSAFADLRAALRSGDVDAAALASMQRELGSALSRAAQGTLTREDVLRLSAAIEQVTRPTTAEPEPQASNAAATQKVQGLRPLAALDLLPNGHHIAFVGHALPGTADPRAQPHQGFTTGR